MERAGGSGPSKMKVHAWNCLMLLSLLDAGFGQLQFSDDKTIDNSESLLFPEENTSRQYAQIAHNSFGSAGSKPPEQNPIFHGRGTNENVPFVKFQRENPVNFYAAIPAISSQLVGQLPPGPIPRNLQRQEYIPYPPNGIPFNYPAHNADKAPQPFVLGPYEISNGGNNYRIQSAATPYPYASKGSPINDEYSFNWPNSHTFQGFDPNYFHPGFLPVLNQPNRDREPLEDNSDNDLSERKQRPIKRSNSFLKMKEAGEMNNL